MKKTSLIVLLLLFCFSAFSQKGVCPGDPPTWCFVEGFAGSSFEWEIEGGEILEDQNSRVLVRWHSPGTYLLRVTETTADGCEGMPVEATVLVQTQAEGDCQPTLEVPNVFTPNGDGHNDYFTVKSAHLEVYKLSIFTRWGKLVYETTDTSTGWDGQIHGRPATVGTYYWVASYGAGDDAFKQKGFVHLMK